MQLSQPWLQHERHDICLVRDTLHQHQQQDLTLTWLLVAKTLSVMTWDSIGLQHGRGH